MDFRSARQRKCINEAAVGLAAMQARRRGGTVDFNRKKKAMALIYLFAGVFLGSEHSKKPPHWREIILQRNYSSG